MPATATSGRPTRSKRRAKNIELIALRINAGLSRDDLAARAQVGRETVRLVEDGFVPTPRTQFAIARALGKLPLDIWPIHTQRAVTR